MNSYVEIPEGVHPLRLNTNISPLPSASFVLKSLSYTTIPENQTKKLLTKERTEPPLFLRFWLSICSTGPKLAFYYWVNTMSSENIRYLHLRLMTKQSSINTPLWLHWDVNNGSLREAETNRWKKNSSFSSFSIHYYSAWNTS